MRISGMSGAEWKRPQHTRWLLACLAGFGLVALAGGISAPVLVVFALIFVVGAVLLGDDTASAAEAEFTSEDAGEAEPENVDEAETQNVDEAETHPDTESAPETTDHGAAADRDDPQGDGETADEPAAAAAP